MGSDKDHNFAGWLAQLGSQEGLTLNGSFKYQDLGGGIYASGGGSAVNPSGQTYTVSPFQSPPASTPTVDTVQVPTSEYNTLVEIASLVDAILEDLGDSELKGQKRVEFFALRERLNRWLLIRSTVTASQSEELLSLLRIRERLANPVVSCGDDES